MLMVISPAKTLDFETKPTVEKFSQPRFLAQSQQLINTLSTLDAPAVASLMSLSDKLAGLNVARFAAWQTPFDLKNAKQAVLAFKGDVYTGLDAESLAEPQLTFAQNHLRILLNRKGL